MMLGLSAAFAVKPQRTPRVQRRMTLSFTMVE
jgi:hypothetical protein